MDWFRHDTNAQGDIKIRKLLHKHGVCAYGAFWLIVELLYRQDGKASAQDIADEFDLIDAEDMKKILENSGLFDIDEDGSWSSKRVYKEIEFQNEARKKKVEAGRIGGLAKANNAITKSSNAKATLKQCHSNALAKPSTIPTIPTIPTNNKGNSNELLAESYASTSDEVSAGESPIIITLLNNRNEEVPIRENLVKMWEIAYPAVDVRAELQKMKAWCMSNPKLRKTSQGMTRFCDNWLKKNQDESGRGTKRNDFYGGAYIKGTDIKMDITAKGEDRSQYDPNVRLEDIL